MPFVHFREIPCCGRRDSKPAAREQWSFCALDLVAIEQAAGAQLAEH
jgi:hypothetical protein